MQRPRRQKEWFDDDSFWRETFPFMFPEKRFAIAGEQVEKILALTQSHGRCVLDLCCGPGRIAIALAQRGFAVTGVDRTRYLLDKARNGARKARLKIEWIREDMRDFVRPDSYDLAVSMFTSFGYFDNREEDEVVLKNVFASLKPGGVFLMDLLGKEWLAKNLLATSSDSLPDGAMMVQTHKIFDDWTRIENEWIIIRKNTARRFRFHHTLYSGLELRERLSQAGFVGITLFGNLNGDTYGSNAQRLIAVARKAN